MASLNKSPFSAFHYFGTSACLIEERQPNLSWNTGWKPSSDNSSFRERRDSPRECTETCLVSPSQQSRRQSSSFLKRAQKSRKARATVLLAETDNGAVWARSSGKEKYIKRINIPSPFRLCYSLDCVPPPWAGHRIF